MTEYPSSSRAVLPWRQRTGKMFRNLARRIDLRRRRPAKMQFVSYPKSGRTWIRYILFELDCARLIEFHHDGFEFNDGGRPPHDFCLSRRLARYGEIEKLVYLDRDPRDVMVSLYHQVTARFSDIFEYRGSLSAFIRDDYFGAENLQKFRRMWETIAERRGFLKISYEACHLDTRGALRQILDYYGLEVSEARLAAAIDKGAFANMKEAEASMAFPQPWLQPRNGSPKVRQGKVGGYREVFSKDDIAFLNQVFERQS
jgi:Sulfotransferase domain